MILIVIGVAVLFSARTALFDQVNDDLEVRSNRFLRGFGPRPVTELELQEALRFATAGGYFYLFTGPRGNSFPAESASEVILPPVDELRADTANGPAYVDGETADGEELRVFVRPITTPTGGTILFQVGRSIEPELQALRRLLFILGAGGLIGLALATAGGFWLAGRALRPIQTAMDAQRTFVADASHELRTPLSLIRANAEIMRRSPGENVDMTFVDDIIKETERLSYLVSQMLTLARADSREAELEREPVELGLLAQDLCRRMQLLAAEKNILVQAQRSGATIVEGDDQRLGELVLILVDNAIKYSEPGGRIDVAASGEGRRVRLTVADTGRGISPEALPHVFDRFFRADKARAREMRGTGLGLAIARWIVDSHHGTIRVESEPQKGTCVSVDLPAADVEFAERDAEASVAADSEPPGQAEAQG